MCGSWTFHYFKVSGLTSAAIRSTDQTKKGEEGGYSPEKGSVCMCISIILGRTLRGQWYRFTNSGCSTGGDWEIRSAWARRQTSALKWKTLRLVDEKVLLHSFTCIFAVLSSETYVPAFSFITKVRGGVVCQVGSVWWDVCSDFKNLAGTQKGQIVVNSGASSGENNTPVHVQHRLQAKLGLLVRAKPKGEAPDTTNTTVSAVWGW